MSDLDFKRELETKIRAGEAARRLLESYDFKLVSQYLLQELSLKTLEQASSSIPDVETWVQMKAPHVWRDSLEALSTDLDSWKEELKDFNHYLD